MSAVISVFILFSKAVARCTYDPRSKGNIKDNHAHNRNTCKHDSI